MGMYTEIRVSLIVKPDASEAVRQVLRMMSDGSFDCGYGKVPTNLPENLEDHPFFHTDRWIVLFRMGSAYFDEDPHSEVLETPAGLSVRVVANLKNYSNEIKKFAEWIAPFCVDQKTPIVTQLYEENVSDREPDEYYSDGRSVDGKILKGIDSIWGI